MTLSSRVSDLAQRIAAEIKLRSFATGDVKLTANATAPSGWLIADGSAISRTTYAALFTAIGTRYGAGNGTDTFNLPDLRTRVPVGLKSGDATFGTLGATGGEIAHALTTPELAAHAHGINDPGHNHGQDAHGHGISDPGHGHNVYDPGHSHNMNHGHGVWDNGHTHGPTALSGFMLYQTSNATRQRFAAGTGTGPYTIGTRSGQIDDIGYGGTAAGGGNHGNYDFNGNTGGAGTGIGIYGNGTGVGVNNTTATNQAAGTGVSVQSAGSGTAHNNMQPYIVLNYLIKT